MASTYGWVITEDHIPVDGLPTAVGKVGPRDLGEELEEQLQTDESHPFELFDDDRILYFRGFLVGDFDGFEPLDDYGAGSGCTLIKVDGKFL